MTEVTGEVFALYIVEREEKIKNAKLSQQEIADILEVRQKKIDVIFEGRIKFK